jgi:hypothetical protein
MYWASVNFQLTKLSRSPKARRTSLPELPNTYLQHYQNADLFCRAVLMLVMAQSRVSLRELCEGILEEGAPLLGTLEDV